MVRFRFSAVLAAALFVFCFCPLVFAEDSSDPDLSLGSDVTEAYDQYAGDLSGQLDDVKTQYDGVVSDSVLVFVGAAVSWIPAEVWILLTLSVASLVVLGILNWLKGWG